jgi:hypothetical protein
VVGLVVYAGVVVAWHAGFTGAAPFVVIPAVLVVMVGAGNLASGRRAGRPAPRFHRPDLDPVPLSSLHGDAHPAPGGDTHPAPGDDGHGSTPAGDPGTPR